MLDNITATVLAEAEAYRVNRVENLPYTREDWCDGDVFDRWCAVVKGVHVWAGRSGTIYARVPNTRDGRLWAWSAAAVVIDGLESTPFDTAEIVTVDETTFALVW